MNPALLILVSILEVRESQRIAGHFAGICRILTESLKMSKTVDFAKPYQNRQNRKSLRIFFACSTFRILCVRR